jgi:hypothetical protein
VRRTVLWLTIIVLFAACENSAGPLGGILGGGNAITPAQATGNWSFTLQRTTTFPACTNPLANGQVITAHTDILSDGTAGSASSWLNPISGTVQPLSGVVRLSDAFSDLLFAAPAVKATAQMELRGTMTSAGAFTGTLTDPEPGFSQVFGTGGCEYSVTGTKTS